jgi:hypothetical protein
MFILPLGELSIDPSSLLSKGGRNLEFRDKKKKKRY